VWSRSGQRMRDLWDDVIDVGMTSTLAAFEQRYCEKQRAL